MILHFPAPLTYAEHGDKGNKPADSRFSWDKHGQSLS